MIKKSNNFINQQFLMFLSYDLCENTAVEYSHGKTNHKKTIDIIRSIHVNLHGIMSRNEVKMIKKMQTTF
jgi:hypothetical protein